MCIVWVHIGMDNQNDGGLLLIQKVRGLNAIFKVKIAGKLIGKY